MFRLVLEFS